MSQIGMEYAVESYERTLRIYPDTSVIGGCLDEEWRDASIRLFDRVRAGKVALVVSDTTLAELAGAPPAVRQVLEDLPKGSIEFIGQGPESEALAEKYIAQGVVSKKMLADAQHIAVATVGKVDVLVSWNFRHIVNLDRIHGFNSVNLRLGYSMLEIRSPLEVWKDEDEDF